MPNPCWLAPTLVLGLLWAGDQPALAQPAQPAEVERAESLAALAYQAYEGGDYTGAVALYKQALEATPSADIVYNLARIYDTKLKDRDRAIAYYRRYTLDTGADPGRLRTASVRLAELVELESIASQTQVTAESASRPEAEPAPAPPASAGDEPGLGGLRIAGIVTGSVGLAALGVGVGFGVAAKADADVAAGACDGNACRTQRGVDAAKDAGDAATVSTIAFVGGGVLAALGITLVVLAADGDADREAAHTWVTPYVGFEAVGARLGRRF